jgi:superfamily II DNA or RNA helicase
MSKFLNFYPDSMTFADHFSYRTEYDAWVKNRIVRIIKWSGVKNVEELKEYLKGIYIRFEADQVLTLPPITYKDILTDNVDDPKLLEAFNNFDDENKSVMPEAKRHAAIMKILLTHRYCKDLLAEVGSIVIFSDHVEPVKRLADKFGVPPITGETTTRERTKIAEDFQSGKQKVVVATIGSFSTGINLTAANHLVFNDYPWVPGDMKQAEARIHRMGQTKPCVVHRIFRSPQDFTIMKAIKEKQSVISQVV